jgi:hypothetical protein
MYVGSRLYDKSRKICSYTSFFRLDEVLPANESAGKKSKPISIESAI